MDDFEEELKKGFLEEATQMLSEAEQCFLTLESDPSNVGTIEQIFRIAHNLKGSSRAVGFDALGSFTHEFESFLLKCKAGEIAITNKTISLLLACNDHVNLFVNLLKSDSAAELDGSVLIDQIKNFTVDSATEVPSRSGDEVGGGIGDGVDIESLFDAQGMAEADPRFEMNSTSDNEEVTETNQVIDSVERSATVLEFNTAPKVDAPPARAATPKAATASQADESIRVSLGRLEQLLNFVGEMVILQTVLREQSLLNNPLLVNKTIDQMGKVTKEVQELSMSLRMVPLRQTFQKMQRIVRDTSATLGKKVNLILEGEDTEVDKTVLESLSNPLVHLIRNAIDHGIESPELRLESGKTEIGNVNLKAYQDRGKLVIEIRDDGAGISADRLRAKAIEKGILRPDQVISDTAAVGLIFHAGFSTKAEVTEVSGRGVGMDVVKTNIEQLQGEVLVDTNLGSGSTFKIILPLTLAIIDGMVVRSGNQRFIIPRSHVHESVKLIPKDLKSTTPAGEVLFLRGENIPVFRLRQLLGVKATNKTETEQIAIIIHSEGRSFAVLVDDIIGQQQIVIKKLGVELKTLSAVSGSAILGDGHPALIIELAELVKKSNLRGKAV